MKTALITGISGQDGSLLAEFLLEKGYRVCAITNDELQPGEKRFSNYKLFYNEIAWKKISLTDASGISEFLKTNNPDEVYHLGAQSFPSAGFQDNYPAFQANTEGVYNLLSSVYASNSSAKFFFAGSSEIFGDNPKGRMTEEDRFYPKTMYGLSKLAGHELVRNYRDQLGKFAVTGFLFNHESPRRGEEFVTRKITLAAAKIKLGLQKKLTLGSLDSKRDWSAAEDFVEGFYLSLQTKQASDYVFSSGKLHTVGDFARKAFLTLDLKLEDHFEIDERFNRPSKFDLVGDPTRAKTVLGWKPKITFEQIVERMVRADYDELRKAK